MYHRVAVVVEPIALMEVEKDSLDPCHCSFLSDLTSPSIGQINIGAVSMLLESRMFFC
jgi:hypothetical protein